MPPILLLHSTPFFWVYSLFGSENDDGLVQTLANIFFIAAIVTFVINIFTPFPPYGKLYVNQGKEPWWNKRFNMKIGWTILCLPSVIVPLIIVTTTERKALWHLPNILGISLFITHYINRTLVSVFSQSVSDGKTPQLYVLAMSVTMSTIDGLLQSHHLTNIHQPTNTVLPICGAIVAVIGLVINIHSDRILTKMRMESATKKFKQPYQIPRGGLFEYVSTANFFGEILEWWGYALVTQEYPQIVFAVWSTVFLGWRAFYVHNFYKLQFGALYPKHRKIIMPFLF